MDEVIQQTEQSNSEVLKTGIDGFDALFDKGGVPRGNSVLIAGGTGTGKSTFCRQVCYNLASQGKHCMYVSFEETIERIEKSMLSFGWNAREYIDGGQFLVQKINPLDILRMKFGSIGGSGSATELSYKIKTLINEQKLREEKLKTGEIPIYDDAWKLINSKSCRLVNEIEQLKTSKESEKRGKENDNDSDNNCKSRSNQSL